MNLQEKISDYLKLNRSPKTIQTYGEALKVYARLVGYRELTAETYAVFLLARAQRFVNYMVDVLYTSSV